VLNLGKYVVLFFSLLAFATCGSDAETPESLDRTDSGDQTLSREPILAPIEGVFRRLWQDPPTLDPHQVSDTTSAAIAVEVFSGLVSINLDLQLEPDLAERWEVSDDGKTYTFFLRREARFHDGKPVTAADVKYSLERALDPKTMSPTVDTYLDDIVGSQEKLSGKAREISGVKVLDEYTVQINIDGPKAYFLAKLTYPTAFVVDRENIHSLGNEWIRQPNGTGPFKLTSYTIGEEMILERNPYFHRGPAKLERAVFILSGGSAMAMYENGEIDITGVGLADLDRVTNPSEPLNRDLAVAPPSFDITYIGLNTSIPPFDDVYVRRSLSYAIDREIIAEQVLANLVTPARGILPPGFPGYTGKIHGLTHDPAIARELLDKSKYSGQMPRIVMTVPGTGGAIGLDLEVIIEMWREDLGILVEIEQVEWATYLEDLNAGELQIFGGLGWQADYPDPQGFLDILFHSSSRLNHSGYQNQEVDRLLEQARTAAWKNRVSLYNQAEQIIIDDAPWIPLWYSGERMVLIKPYVTGYRLTPLIIPKLWNVSVHREY